MTTQRNNKLEVAYNSPGCVSKLCGSPVLKKRKMLTPVRSVKSNLDLDAELEFMSSSDYEEADNDDAHLNFGIRTSKRNSGTPGKKALFGTPESGRRSEKKRSFLHATPVELPFHIGFNANEMEKSPLKAMRTFMSNGHNMKEGGRDSLETNYNPFYQHQEQVSPLRTGDNSSTGTPIILSPTPVRKNSIPYYYSPGISASGSSIESFCTLGTCLHTVCNCDGVKNIDNLRPSSPKPILAKIARRNKQPLRDANAVVNNRVNQTVGATDWHSSEFVADKLKASSKTSSSEDNQENKENNSTAAQARTNEEILFDEDDSYSTPRNSPLSPYVKLYQSTSLRNRTAHSWGGRTRPEKAISSISGAKETPLLKIRRHSIIPPTPSKDDANSLPISSSPHFRSSVRSGSGSSEETELSSRSFPHNKTVSRFQDEFEEKAVLSSGSFGTVYKCKKRIDGCYYAVKVSKKRFRRKANRDQVLREVFALSAICNVEENQHVVRYFSAFFEDDRLYIQTELCERSLEDIINTKDYSKCIDRVARDVARQILEGLAHLHKHNLVHLDVKPANIFIKKGVFKLGDLGHACFSNADDASSTSYASPTKIASFSLLGTPQQNNDCTQILVHNENLPPPPPLFGADRPQELCGQEFIRCESEQDQDKKHENSSSANNKSLKITRAASYRSFDKDINEGDQRYLAPEMLRESYEHLAKADIFSLGASLYEMSLGRRLPANGQEWHEIRNGILDPGALAAYSSPMQDLVRQMLRRDPVERPSAEFLIASGGPNGVLRTELEEKLAREKAAADDYRKQLARLRKDLCTTRNSDGKEFELHDRYRFRRSNTF